MIEIVYEKRTHSLVVSGHAGAGKKGEDIVCAAVSALVLTLAENVDVLVETGTAAESVIDVKDGSARLACTAKKGMEPVVRCIFDAVCCGFSLVARMHPEHVKYEVT